MSKNYLFFNLSTYLKSALFFFDICRKIRIIPVKEFIKKLIDEKDKIIKNRKLTKEKELTDIIELNKTINYENTLNKTAK